MLSICLACSTMAATNLSHFTVDFSWPTTVAMQCSAIVIICRLWRECILAAVRIMQCSLKCSPVLLLFACPVWWQNLKGPLNLELKVGWKGFRLCDAASRKWCKMELKWQLITNRKSYIGFWLQQKSMTLNEGTVGYRQLSWLFVHIEMQTSYTFIGCYFLSVEKLPVCFPWLRVGI